MRHEACAEKARDTGIGPVNELVDSHHMTGRVVLLKGAAGGNGQDVGNTGHLQRSDIGAVGHVSGRQPVASAMARQEDKLHPADPAGNKRVRRRPPGRLDLCFAPVFQPLKRIEARAANDPEFPAAHGVLPCP